MSHLSVGQIIVDAQRMAGRVKDLDSLSSALLEEAESNNRLVESLRQFQDDIESLNRISNNKTNADMVNRIQQQNVNSSEILKENRELKVCLEDYERAMEIMMQKYREHTVSKVLEGKINFKEVYNERLWQIIREQRDKIHEMATVMQHAAAADDDTVQRELKVISRLRLENETLRELLEISNQYGSAKQSTYNNNGHLLEEKAVQTEVDDLTDELSLSGASVENMNNNTVIQAFNATVDNLDSSIPSSTYTANMSTIVISRSPDPVVSGLSDNSVAIIDNNNGPNITSGIADRGNHLPDEEIARKTTNTNVLLEPNADDTTAEESAYIDAANAVTKTNTT